jgi:hypothetical protein
MEEKQSLAQSSTAAPSPTAILQGYNSVSGAGLDTAMTATLTNESGANTTGNMAICTSAQKVCAALSIILSIQGLWRHR